MDSDADSRIRDFRASDIDWLVDQHARHYAAAEGFDASFGALVEQILRDFAAGHDAGCERGFVAEAGSGARLGSVFCVRREAEVAQLRLFYLVPEARGQGLGLRLLAACTGFAKAAGYRRMVLWTHESHRAACALYARTGWRLAASEPVESFGQSLVRQHWERPL